MNTIQSKWDNLLNGVFKGHTIDPDQLSEMKMLFYCGAMAAMMIQEEISLEPDLSDEAFNAIMDGVAEEVNTYIADFMSSTHS